MDFAQSIARFPLPIDQSRADSVAALYAHLATPVQKLIAGAAGSSPYLASLLEQEAAWLTEALNTDDIVRVETSGFENLEVDELDISLRRAKRRIALHTALADLGGVQNLEWVTGTLSDFADRAVDLALRAHIAKEVSRGKIPATEADAAGVFVLAMGKGGARELNYSSDIDLIVLYDDSAYAEEDQQEARAALIRATRRMSATLSEITEHGYVFRTDLRLRPDAAVTPVCISTSAALAYYESEGRTWERAAYIKARAAAGNIAAGEKFLSELRPFIWRKHLDFAAIQDAHDMRLRIREHKQLGGKIDVPGHNMKLGSGGIREIEFFTQTRQLIAGGRDADLRQRDTVGGLRALAKKGWVPEDVTETLIAHYREHRDIEHRIQMVNDSQTHAVPKDRQGIAGIAALMGEADADAWSQRLKSRLEQVSEMTERFFAPDDKDELPEISNEAQTIIDGWHSYPALKSPRARQVFKRVLPGLLVRIVRSDHPDETIARFDSFLGGLPAGVQLFSLFDANPQLIDLIVDICGTSAGLSRYLVRHSAVLDAVLGGSFFSAWPGQEGLSLDLAQQIKGLKAGKSERYEEALDAARRWAHEWHFRIGVHHLRGLIGAEEAAAQYSDLAGACISALVPVTVDDFTRRYGAPPGKGAVVLGMGSLGARQLNASSDLDLIVIYDANGAESSDGPKPLATRPYYARLTQAFITALSAPTAEGRLYEVDMRLRPSGRQGPVATSVQSFEDYQLNEAWTWEHLALTRARPVAFAGKDGAGLSDNIEAIRLDVIGKLGGAERVLPDLASMRQRIAEAKSDAVPGDAKNGAGRLQDIDLFAQSLALRAASPARGSFAQLRAGKRAGLISAEEESKLGAAYRFLWQFQMSMRLLSEDQVAVDMLGKGAQAFLLRECGCDDVRRLDAKIKDLSAAAAEIIARHLPAVPESAS